MDSHTNIYLSDPDVCLMLEFQRGQQASFETLMRKYFPPVLNFIYRFVGNQHSAEDLTQEVFIRVYKSASSYRPESKFQTWLYTIAKNLSLNELRKYKNPAASLDETFEKDGDTYQRQIADPKALNPGKEILHKEQAEVVKAAITALPPNQRMAVLLRRYDDFSYGEIAAAMGLSLEAVKSLLNRAKENLKESLKEWVSEE